MVNEKQVMLKKLITNILLSLKLIKVKEEVKTRTSYTLTPIEEPNEWAEFKPAKKPKAKVDKPKQKVKNEKKQTRSKK